MPCYLILLVAELADLEDFVVYERCTKCRVSLQKACSIVPCGPCERLIVIDPAALICINKRGSVLEAARQPVQQASRFQNYLHLVLVKARICLKH